MNIHQQQYSTKIISIIVLCGSVILFFVIYVWFSQNLAHLFLLTQPSEAIISTQNLPEESSMLVEESVDSQPSTLNESAVASPNLSPETSSMQKTMQTQNTTIEPSVNQSTEITATTLIDPHPPKSLLAGDVAIRHTSQHTCTAYNKNMLCWSQLSSGQKPATCIANQNGTVSCWR